MLIFIVKPKIRIIFAPLNNIYSFLKKEIYVFGFS